jgi:thiamine biosynthesis lipoprotein
MSTTVTHRRFRAMGSDAHVILVGGPSGLIEEAALRIAMLEQRWSRFIPSSEVSLLNDRAGAWVSVSPETRLLVERGYEAWRLTGGRFDPTVLGAVVRAGYDVSFEHIDDPRPSAHSTLFLGCADIEIDGGRVRLPPHTGFDPGGIGKGLAADLVVAELLAAGADGACVNLGGDIRVAGTGPRGEGWIIDIDHLWSPEPIGRIGLLGGGVATSTTLARRWTADGDERHHVIDPDTGQPSETDLTLTTVVAAEAWMAEVLAKAVLLRGAEHPFDLMGASGAEAVVVDDQGNVAASSGMDRFVDGAALPHRIERRRLLAGVGARL